MRLLVRNNSRTCFQRSGRGGDLPLGTSPMIWPVSSSPASSTPSYFAPPCSMPLNSNRDRSQRRQSTNCDDASTLRRLARSFLRRTSGRLRRAISTRNQNQPKRIPSRRLEDRRLRRPNQQHNPLIRICRMTPRSTGCLVRNRLGTRCPASASLSSRPDCDSAKQSPSMNHDRRPCRSAGSSGSLCHASNPLRAYGCTMLQPGMRSSVQLRGINA